MNLQKLFEIQAELDCHINNEHLVQEAEDRLAKKILALQVELGELCNCWRGFKFWSHDQEPRRAVYEICEYCEGRKTLGFQRELCWYCGGTGLQVVKRPLLEEYVDCLRFILSIGLELKDKFMLEQLRLQNLQSKEKPIDTTTQFNGLFVTTASLYMSIDDEYYDNADRQGIYEELFERFLSLAEMLGFTWEQIEESYFEKKTV